jgi:hypothetical protein
LVVPVAKGFPPGQRGKMRLCGSGHNGFLYETSCAGAGEFKPRQPIPQLGIANVSGSHPMSASGDLPRSPRPGRGRSALAEFLRQRNILWGELVGGLLVIGCSTALVISLWHTFSDNPLFKFFTFTGANAAVYGAGLYTQRRWRLESTSRGLLVIAVLLTPLAGAHNSGRCGGAPLRVGGGTQLWNPTRTYRFGICTVDVVAGRMLHAGNRGLPGLGRGRNSGRHAGARPSRFPGPDGVCRCRPLGTGSSPGG